MEQVSMNDGLDGRETLAFGLAAGEIAVFVLSLMGAYAVLRSGLAGAVAWTLAALLAGGGAVLAWGRLAGRPLLEWTVLLAAFTVRTRRTRSARLRRRLRGWRVTAGVLAAALRTRLALRTATTERSRERGAVVIPLALRRVEPGAREPAGAEQLPGGSASRVVGFFSLAGGTGRTTIAVEVATILAVRGRVSGATGVSGPRVALIDLATRNPTVGLRLRIPAPSDGGGALVAHHTGLLVGLPAASSLPTGWDGSAPPAAVIESAERAGADMVVVDCDCDAGDECAQLLRRCDQLLVTLTPTAAGVVDAYRSTALLRRMGLGQRFRYVVNRWRPGVDLGETMADLGGVIVAEIPEDPALGFGIHAGVVRVDGRDAAAAALEVLATHIENAGFSSAPGLARWGSNAG